MTADADGRVLRAAATGELARRLSPRYLEEHCLLPLGVDDAGTVRVAAGAPLDDTVLDELARLYGRPVRVEAASADDVRAAILGARRDDEAERGADAAPERGDEPALRADEAPVVTLVTGILRDALRSGASDVHLEPSAAGLRVRFRLDGVLHDVAHPARQFRDAVASRVKILASLDIAERRLPQDGRVRFRLDERDVDLRVSTLPTLHGESIVLRILDHAGGARGLGELGMPDGVRERFERLVRRNAGIVLVTGPTGSGKTTTLYAALAGRNEPGVKVVTVEDPVEYRIEGVVQVPVNRKAGLAFASALRSILRHDPDVIMVGEMRDAETAAIAIQAALTGHQVFSTLHTTDASSGVARLVDMGIEPFLVASTVQGILAQRLVRVLCERCAAAYAPSREELATAPPAAMPHGTSRFRRAVGCEACAGTGYRGRTGLFELVTVTERLRALVVRGAALDELRAAAADEGTVPLRTDGWRLAHAGITTIEEVLRVTDD